MTEQERREEVRRKVELRMARTREERIQQQFNERMARRARQWETRWPRRREFALMAGVLVGLTSFVFIFIGLATSTGSGVDPSPDFQKTQLSVSTGDS